GDQLVVAHQGMAPDLVEVELEEVAFGLARERLARERRGLRLVLGQGDAGGLRFRPEALELGVVEIGIDEHCFVLARAQRTTLACRRQRLGETLLEACETGCAHGRSLPISNPR